MKIKDKKILITGGAGFIGSHTADKMIEKGAKVVIIDNLVTGREKNINNKARFYRLNIADPKIEKVFKKEKPDFVYHLAFNVLVPESLKDPLIDKDSIVGSINIIKNCQKYGVKKIVFSSSGFTYGNKNTTPIKEIELMEPISPYAIAKNTVENYLKFFNKAYGLPYVTLRYSTVYGPRQIFGAMADYIRKLKGNKQAKIWGDGSKTRDYIYIEDVVNANIFALDLPNNYSDPTFNIGTGKETTLNEIYGEIAKLLNKKSKPIYMKDRPGELIKYSLDYSKIKKALGWKPEYEIREGLRKKLTAEGLI